MLRQKPRWHFVIQNQFQHFFNCPPQEGMRVIKMFRERPVHQYRNYSGLTRYVRIYTTPKTDVLDIVLIYDVTLDENFAAAKTVVKVITDVVGDVDAVEVMIMDEDRQVVGGGSGCEAVIAISAARLWQLLDVYLYKTRVDLKQDGELIDC